MCLSTTGFLEADYLYLKALNLPKPDKWGTSQLIAFLQQVREEGGGREGGEGGGLLLDMTNNNDY